MTVHFQPVVLPICPPPTQLVPLTGVMLVGGGIRRFGDCRRGAGDRGLLA